MQKKSLIGIGLAAILSIGTIITVSADTDNNYLGNGRSRGRCNSNFRRNSDDSCPGYNVVSRTKGYEIIKNILMEKFDLSKEYIEEAFSDGKTLGEILDENNIDIEEFKKEFMAIRIAEIDEAVQNGTITAEEGETIKKNFLTNFEEMNFKDHMGGFNSNSRGIRNGQGRGRGQRRGGCCN